MGDVGADKGKTDSSKPTSKVADPRDKRGVDAKKPDTPPNLHNPNLITDVYQINVQGFCVCLIHLHGSAYNINVVCFNTMFTNQQTTS